MIGGGLCGAALGKGGVDCKISVRGGGCTRMGCGMWGEGMGLCAWNGTGVT